MKKYFLAIFLLILFTSCSISQKEIKKEETQTWNIFTWKVDVSENFQKDLSSVSDYSWFYKKFEKTWYYSEIDETETKYLKTEKITSKNKNPVEKLELEKVKEIFCKYDKCLDKNIKFSEKNNILSYKWEAKDENEEGIKIELTLDKTKNKFEKKDNYMMWSSGSSISLIDWYYYYEHSSVWCGWADYTQIFLDKDLKEVNYLPNFKNFKIWDIEYIPYISFKDLRESMIYENQWNFYDSEKEKNIEFDSEESVKNEILKEISEEKETLKQNYFVNFKKYPNLTVYYKSSNYVNQAEKTLMFDKDLKIDKYWNLLDYELTKNIFPKVLGSKIFMKESNTDYDSRIEKFEEKDLPLFRVKKLDWVSKNGKDLYFVYSAKWYKLEPTAELCKPLVYYYSKNPIKNSLTLNLKKNDYFTTLIPEFNDKNTWNFEANNWKISVENQKFDYLYYSMVNVWYRHNEDWWIVKWEDIVDFFNDKLDKINFTKSEKKDFIDHWKELYKKEKYYFVSFKYNDELDKIIKLDFKKSPDKTFRVLLDSYELKHFSSEKRYFLYDKKDKAKFDKYLIKRFERWNSSEEVFEWWWVLQTLEKRYVK